MGKHALALLESHSRAVYNTQQLGVVFPPFRQSSGFRDVILMVSRVFIDGSSLFLVVSRVVDSVIAGYWKSDEDTNGSIIDSDEPTLGCRGIISRTR